MNRYTALKSIALLATAGALLSSGGLAGGGGDCAAFGQQNCLPADGARCFQGTCQCCWALQSGSTYSCYSCVPACTDRGYGCSSDGTCVFKAPPAGPACTDSSSSGSNSCPTPPNCGKGTHQQNCTCVPN